MIPWAHRPENKAARREYMKQWRRDNPLQACVHSLVGGARARGKVVGVDLDYITVAEIEKLLPADMRCPCCKQKMVAQVEKGKHPMSLSLDRVDSDKGYVRGNVAIICQTCNVRKRDMGVHELRLLLRYIESHGS